MSANPLDGEMRREKERVEVLTAMGVLVTFLGWITLALAWHEIGLGWLAGGGAVFMVAGLTIIFMVNRRFWTFSDIHQRF